MKKLRRCVFLCRIRSYFFQIFPKQLFCWKKIIYEKISFLGGPGGGWREGSWKYRERSSFCMPQTCQNFSEFQEGCLFHYYNEGYPLLLLFRLRGCRSKSFSKSPPRRWRCCQVGDWWHLSLCTSIVEKIGICIQNK